MKDVADDLALIVRNAIAYIKELEAELARCKQVCAATAEAWREEAALAEPVQEPYCHVYEYDSVFGLHREFYPREYNGRKPDRTVPLFTAPPQRKPLVDPAEYDDAGAAERYNRGLK